MRLVLAMVFLGGLSSWAQMATPAPIPCVPITWSDPREAGKDDQAYALYFCSSKVALTAGTGTGIPPHPCGSMKDWPEPILVDKPAFQHAMKENGIHRFIKVAHTAENEGVFSKYEAIDNTLVICAPDGEAMGRWRGNACNMGALYVFFGWNFARKKVDWEARTGRQICLVDPKVSIVNPNSSK